MPPEPTASLTRQACSACNGVGSFPPVDMHDEDYPCNRCGGTGETRAFDPGDVLRYFPQDGNHCRQGTAIVHEDGRAVDTFWGLSGGNDGHVLRAGELEEAEVLFKLGEYRQLGEHWDKRHDEWLTYAPADRECIGSQHQYQSTYFVRIGAEPDLETQIRNAYEKLREAEEKLRSAGRSIEWAARDIAKLEAKRDVA